MRLKLIFIIGIFVVMLVALIWWWRMPGMPYRVQVCMAYNGKNECRQVSSNTESNALQTAEAEACTQLVHATSDDPTTCERSQPASVKWLRRR